MNATGKQEKTCWAGQLEPSELLERLGKSRSRHMFLLSQLLGAVAGPEPIGRDGQAYETTTGKDGPKKVVSIHPIELMLSRGRLDARQYAAADRFRMDWLVIAMGRGGADFTRRAVEVLTAPSAFIMVDSEYIDLQTGEVVKCRAQRRPVTFPPSAVKQAKTPPKDVADYILAAHDELKRAAKSVGHDKYQLLVSICGEENFIKDLAGGKWGNRKTVMKKFKWALNALADHYGMPELRDTGRIGAARDDDYRSDPTGHGYDEAVRGR
jgi:hypothetical protein